jgi:hypothetical protein
MASNTLDTKLREDLERLKKKSGITNIWQEAENNNWFKKNEKK